MEVKFYEQCDDALLKFAVIAARSKGKWVFCKHKERETFECPGGRREPGEAIIDTARRELYEETGAVDFSLLPVCAYSVTGKTRVNDSGEESFGMLYTAEISSFEEELHSEIERILLTEELPAQWTYPLIQPKLLQKVQSRANSPGRRLLETPTLLLHQGSSNDTQDLYQNLWQHEHAFSCMFTKASPSLEAAQKKTEAYAEMHRQVSTEFFVYEKPSMQCIGIAGIKELSPGRFTVTDIAIGPAFWGKGYGKQILNALENLAFTSCLASELLYTCFASNLPSCRLALSCGFVYSHSEASELRKNGENVLLHCYRKEH